ncbi:hypothetical protein [Arthrobacter sp. NPDC090010]|uniref:hypothetical protein n=1 Tax=Arthrobacter sp. NPDC090010 TaxID=3363942 RepID=UPI0037FBCEC9
MLVLGLGAVGVAATVPAPAPAARPPAPRILMAGVPGYQSIVDSVKAKADLYRSEWKAGRLNLFVPATPAGTNYIREYLADLDSRHVAGLALGGLSGQDKAVLARGLSGYLSSVDSLEKKFRSLAPLGTAGTFRNAAGKPVSFTGKISPKQENARLEALARGWVAEPDAEGSYIPSATALVQTFGLSVEWDFQKLSAQCPSKGPVPADVVAVFCTATPLVIYANRDTAAAGQVFYSPVIVSVLKHELSHYLITQVCGTPDPTAAGKDFEAITNSYAVQFLGAGYEDLQQSADGPHPEYRMTDRTDSLARKIHGGGCI